MSPITIALDSEKNIGKIFENNLESLILFTSETDLEANSTYMPVY